MVLMSSLASRPLSRHRSVLPPRLPPKLTNHVDSLAHVPRHLAGALWPFSVCGFPDPFSRLSASGKVPPLPEVPPAGFGYPLDGLKSLKPSEASFSPQRSWASPFKAFLLHKGREALSNPSLRSHASPQNLAASSRRLSGFLPSWKPCPSLLPQVFTPGRDLLLS